MFFFSCAVPFGFPYICRFFHLSFPLFWLCSFFPSPLSDNLRDLPSSSVRTSLSNALIWLEPALTQDACRDNPQPDIVIGVLRVISHLLSAETIHVIPESGQQNIMRIIAHHLTGMRVSDANKSRQVCKLCCACVQMHRLPWSTQLPTVVDSFRQLLLSPGAQRSAELRSQAVMVSTSGESKEQSTGNEREKDERK